MPDLALLPTGRLVLGEGPDLPGGIEGPLGRAFEKGPAEGLLHLGFLSHEWALPPVFSYWRRFAERYLTELCHVPEPAEDLKAPLPPPREDLEELAGAAPPMKGGEYLRPGTLERLWEELDARARAEIAAWPGGLAEWLRARNPLWHRVGRVCFHLAENREDAERPFAFLATYAPRLLEGGRVLYQPLGKALEEYAGARKRQELIRLLAPVQRAAERCPWVKDLVDSGEVFHPLRWTPGEAYLLLKDAPQLEESGLLVRLPDWWTRRPPRVRVSVSVGASSRVSRLDAGALLRFEVGVALEGEALSREEWERILAGSDGLVFLKGRWVEVDREKLRAALEQWKRVEREVGRDGVSFIEGMRLLAGIPLEPERSGLFEGETAAWSEVRAGPGLEARLREIREPGSLAAALPGKELRTALRPYQETGVKWLSLLSRLGLGACLADDMGLGKTVQVLALLLMRKRERGAPALVILPASLLANWKAEMERFAPSLAVRFAHPSQTPAEELERAAADPQAFLEGTDVVLTTYGMAARLEWLSTVSWGLVVLDEAQAIKNPAARQTRAVKRLRAGARIALTGTPVENRLADLWSIFDFLCPGLLGSARVFGDLVKRLEAREGDQYGPLRRLVGPYILRRLKTDKAVIADLPDKTEVRAYCRLSRRQAALYEQATRELAGALDGLEGIRRRGLILSFLLRFKQICNHPDQWLGSGTYAPEESGKFRRLREIAEEIAARQEKMLVFTQFREMTGPLAGFLRDVFGRPGLVLHGEVPVGRRKALVDDFQREEGPPFFVLSLRAGGTGLNLTAASHVVHFDRWWNPAVENQATDRAFRIGQKRNVLVHKFICQGTVEERIDALIGDKIELAEGILEGGEARLVTEMGDKELMDLIRLDASTIKED